MIKLILTPLYTVPKIYLVYVVLDKCPGENLLFSLCSDRMPNIVGE